VVRDGPQGKFGKVFVDHAILVTVIEAKTNGVIAELEPVPCKLNPYRRGIDF
jgi:hypothetical protein